MPSDVQVFVRFRDRCVFAGEEVSCVITFKNVSDAYEPSIGQVGNRGQPRSSNVLLPSGRNVLPSRAKSRLGQAQGRHQATFSLSSPPLPKDLEQARQSQRPDKKHGRSVSIVSIGSTNTATSPDKALANPMRGAPNHHRSSTLQNLGDAPRRPSPGRHLTNDNRQQVRNGRRSPLSSSRVSPSNEPREITADFKFPPDNLLNASTPESGRGTPILGLRPRPPQRMNFSHSHPTDHRDSMDNYTHSNHSEETFTSEQPSILSDRPQLNNTTTRPLIRNNSVRSSRPQVANMLMGYAQVNATFTLDASMVDQTPFEEVKRKGFLGGQAGGGVVGVKKKARPSSGLFSSFGFGSLAESLESVMGGDNLSSVKEMKAVIDSRAVPLLSTPQSLLFVDLRLEPGEGKSYTFSFRLPRGLPSSYRGKAITIAYNLTIGVQGAPGKQEMQAVRQINVPIRVFSGVDSDGEIFGHDLMQPYVILKDVATTKAIEMESDDLNPPPNTDNNHKITGVQFLQYVDRLLDKSRRRQSSSATIDTMFGTFAPEKSAAIRAINRAIMFSNQITAASESSPNRFEIARSGLKIATVILNRSLHRLGETVTVAIDFAEGQMTCTSLRATLESAERVANSLAVRSASAISRITKKVYSSRSENVLFADRAVFSPTIPPNATPTFVTSGVNLEWYMKLEFGTVRQNIQDTALDQTGPNLLEEVLEDERGRVNIAVESLECDTFEVLIPLTVYGDLTPDGKEGEEVVGIPI